MQTFLPYPSFVQSARCLDHKRLNSQRREARQILKALHLKRLGVKAGWQHHPATLMWEGHETALALYSNVMHSEWLRRGYRSNGDLLYPALWVHSVELPGWFYDDSVHSSHRSNLLRKNQSWYSQLGWSEPDDLPYVWPRAVDYRSKMT